MKKTKPKTSTAADDKTVDLHIEKLLVGGQGLSHIGSMACFINDVIAYEIVRARIVEIKKHYLEASCCEIVQPSPHRITPPCLYVGECGGCHFQHIEYSHQLQLKAEIVHDCLKRIAGIEDPPVQFPLPSPSVFHYRTRANLKISTSPSIRIGFYRRRTHEIIAVNNCRLLAPALNQALAHCWRVLKEQPEVFANATDLCIMQSTKSEQVLIAAQKGSVIKAHTIFEPFARAASAPFSCASSSLVLSEIIKGITFIRTPFTFYQINGEQNVCLINLVLDLLSPAFKKPILDLYCGCGNFSLFCAQQGSDVVGIDANSHAIAEARYNAQYNGITHCTFFCDDVQQRMRQFLTHEFYSILLNPSRQGCGHKVIDEVARIKPHLIVYISCHPATLARDLKRLLQHGYRIEVIQPVDMFPQTYHIETVIKLVKS